MLALGLSAGAFAQDQRWDNGRNRDGTVYTQRDGRDRAQTWNNGYRDNDDRTRNDGYRDRDDGYRDRDDRGVYRDRDDRYRNHDRGRRDRDDRGRDRD